MIPKIKCSTNVFNSSITVEKNKSLNGKIGH